MSSSLRSSNFKVMRIAPEISFSSNFSTMDGSKPALYIHLATCFGVHKAISFEFRFSTAFVNVLMRRCWLAGTSGILVVFIASAAALCALLGLGVIGDIARAYSSSLNSVWESTEARNR